MYQVAAWNMHRIKGLQFGLSKQSHTHTARQCFDTCISMNEYRNIWLNDLKVGLFSHSLVHICAVLRERCDAGHIGPSFSSLNQYVLKASTKGRTKNEMLCPGNAKMFSE